MRGRREAGLEGAGHSHPFPSRGRTARCGNPAAPDLKGDGCVRPLATHLALVAHLPPGSAGQGDPQDTRLNLPGAAGPQFPPPPSRLPTRQRGSSEQRIPPATCTPAPPPFPRGQGTQQGGGAGTPVAPGTHARGRRPPGPSILAVLGEGTRWCGRPATAREARRICPRLPPLRGPPAHRDAGRSRGEAGEGTSGAGSARRARRGLGSRHPPAQAGTPAARGRRGRRHRRGRGRHHGRRGRGGRGRRGAGRGKQAAARLAATGGRGRLRLRLQ